MCSKKVTFCVKLHQSRSKRDIYIYIYRQTYVKHIFAIYGGTGQMAIWKMWVCSLEIQFQNNFMTKH